MFSMLQVCQIRMGKKKSLLNNNIYTGPNLKVVSTMSVGYDHIDLATAKEKNVQIGYTPDVLTDATADLTVMLVLAAARHMKLAQHAAQTGEVNKNFE